MPSFLKFYRYQVEWTNQSGEFKSKQTYLKRTADKYAEHLKKHMNIEAVVREL